MKKLVISLLAFIVVFHMVVIYIVVQKKYELTSPDYYAKDMNYQSEIEAKRRAATFQWQIEYVQDRVVVKCDNPIALNAPTLDLVRPNNASSDRALVLQPLDDQTWVAHTQLEPGPWRYILKATGEKGDLQVEGRWSL